MKINKLKIASLLTCCLMAVTSTGCFLDDDYSDIVIKGGEVEGSKSELTVESKRGSSISLTSDNSLSIDRIERTEEKPMGKEGTWTVFVYMCGSDLESDGGYASSDISEMIDSSVSDNVKFVVETGGSTKWSINGISNNSIERYLISDESIELVGVTVQSDMGNPQSLTDFLTWGIENYSAANMGLVMWNHGGGSVSGVCFDELNDYDSLTLAEVDNALTTVYNKMTDKFEFIGFDACLMASVETANVLAPHANYMYASEETEPGYGWDYTTIGNAIQSNNNITGDELGKIVADSFYQSCEDCYSEDDATFSVTDLSKIDALVDSINTVSESMYTNMNDSEILAETVRDVTSAKNYGGNNESEGYTNMVDLGSMMNSISGVTDGTDAVVSALNDAVIYNVYGDNEEGSAGLTIYYPLSINDSEELVNFKNVCVSPYYMSFVDKLSYASYSYGNYTEYTDGEWLEAGVSLWDTEVSQEEEYWDYFDESTDDEDITYISDETNEDTSIYYSVEPYIDSEGTYTFTIDSESLDYISGVYCNIYGYDSETGWMIDLGCDDYVYYDYETGVAEDMFDGCWFMLADGQELCMYISEEGEDYNIYTTPVEVNGEEKNLQVKMNLEDSTIEILGVWDGIDENGMSGTCVTKLEKGDKIVPLYDCYDENGEYADSIEGDEYEYTGKEDVYWDYLCEWDYLYSFEVDDIFGNQYETDSTEFTVDENGDIYYYE